MNNSIFRFYRYLALLLAVLFISACADDDNVDQPTELVPFYSKYYLDVTWHKATGDGAGNQYLFLHPLILKEIAVTTSHDGVINIIGIDTGDFEQALKDYKFAAIRLGPPWSDYSVQVQELLDKKKEKASP